MVRRTTWVLLLLFAALAIFALYVSREGISLVSGEPTQTAQPELIDFDTASIRELIIEDNQDRAVTLARNQDGSWTYTIPADLNGESSEIEAAVDSIASLRILNRLETASDLHVYGLSTPAYVVNITLEGGKKQVLLIGLETPTGSGYYAQFNEGDALIIDRFGVENILNLLIDPPIVTPIPTVEIEATP